MFPNLPAWFEQGLNLMGIRYVVDYDDAIFHNYDLSSNPLKRLFAKKIDKVMQGAALVVCGNAYLAERARQAGARRIEIVPTVVDLERYAVGDQKQGGRIVIGWVGSPTTAKYLEVVAPALQEIAAEFPVQLRVIGAQFDLPGLDVDCRLWSEESEVREIQNFDIGIMPLLDSPWERGKCGYKLIQYMACGVPGIASPVGVNKEIIANGVNGYLAASKDDWLSAFRLLCTNAQARRAMGEHGRRMVEQRYCLQVTGPFLAKLFQEVATIKGVA
jgi:glycosyltransferase involved in cell wall biosynthesis